MSLEQLMVRLCAYMPDVAWLALFLQMQPSTGPFRVEGDVLLVDEDAFDGPEGHEAFAELIVQTVLADEAHAALHRSLLRRFRAHRTPMRAHAELEDWLARAPESSPDPLGEPRPLDPSTLKDLHVPRAPVEIALLIVGSLRSLDSGAQVLKLFRWAVQLPSLVWFQHCVASAMHIVRQRGFLQEVASSFQEDAALSTAARRFGDMLKNQS